MANDQPRVYEFKHADPKERERLAFEFLDQISVSNAGPVPGASDVVVNDVPASGMVRVSLTIPRESYAVLMVLRSNSESALVSHGEGDDADPPTESS